MVKVIKEKESNFTDDRVTSQTFLSSINTWYKEDGIELGVERVHAKDKDGKYGKQCMFIFNCSILSDMPKCRARELDNKGKVIITQNEMGEDVESIEVIDDADSVVFFLYMPYTEDGDIKCSQYSANYKFIKPIFEASGEIEGDVSFTFEAQELLDCAEGYEFVCKVGRNRNKKLIPVAVNL